MCKGPGVGACFNCWRHRKKVNVAEAKRSRGVATVKQVSSALVVLEALQALARSLDLFSTAGSH